MALLTGLTADGLEVPVQVKPDGKLVAEGLTGPPGGVGPRGDVGPVGPTGATGATGTYESGTWTPVYVSGLNTSAVNIAGAYYTKVGQMVWAGFVVTTPTGGGVAGLIAPLVFDGLPFPATTFQGGVIAGATNGFSSVYDLDMSGSLITGTQVQIFAKTYPTANEMFRLDMTVTYLAD
jgi:hypothetical protein